MDVNFQPEASQLLQWRAEGKLSFLRTLFSPDGTIIPLELAAAREKWRRTVRSYSGEIIELPRQMSEWDVFSGSSRAFYAQYPECVDTVIYSPGEPFIEALACQSDEVKQARTFAFQRRMIGHIAYQEWHLLQQDIDDIFAVDPLNRPHRPPTPEDWSNPEREPSEEEGETASTSSTAFHPFDPAFDWGRVCSPPAVATEKEE